MDILLPYERKSLLLMHSRRQIEVDEGCVLLYQIWRQVGKKASKFKLSLIERGRKYIPDSEMISHCTSAQKLLVNQVEMLWLKFHNYFAGSPLELFQVHTSKTWGHWRGLEKPESALRRPKIIIWAISLSKVRNTYQSTLVSKSQCLLRWEHLRIMVWLLKQSLL